MNRRCCAPGKRLCPCIEGSLQERQPKDVQPQVDALPLRQDEGPNELQEVHKGLQSHLCTPRSTKLYGMHLSMCLTSAL